MQLNLSDQEMELLARIVEEYYSSLREEIHKTEDHEFKRELKEEEGLVKGLLGRLKP